MAFMIPVVKKDWDIYRINRSRNSSTCSNHPVRSRQASETHSDAPSLSTSPESDIIVGTPHRHHHHHHRPAIIISSSRSSRASSRASQISIPQTPNKCQSAAASPPKANSQSSLNKFHNKLVDKLKATFRLKEDSHRTEAPQSS